MLYYLFYTSVYICAVILILELKMHAKNRNVHVYTCTNFQELLNRGREDVRVIETSDHKTHICIFPLFLILVDRQNAKSGTNTEEAALSSLQSSFTYTYCWTNPYSFSFVFLKLFARSFARRKRTSLRRGNAKAKTALLSER